MTQATRIAKAAGRAVLGAFSGAVLASIGLVFLGEAVFSYHPPDHGFGPLFMGMGIGALVGAAIGVFAGAWELRGKTRDAVVGLLTGAVAGLLAGVLFGVVAAAWYGEPGYGKHAAGARAAGIIIGVPVGCVLGGICGWLVGCRVSGGVPDDLELAVRRFCAQLEREGYQAVHDRSGDCHIIVANKRVGGAVTRHLARRVDGGIRIEEIRVPGP